MTPRDTRFRQAAIAYLVYGVVYWLGGLALAVGGLGPRGTERGGLAWFLVGALLVVTIPALLVRDHAWFDRFVLSRRDFARLLTVLILVRAVEVARIARAPRVDRVPVLGLDLPFATAAWVFCLLTVAVGVMVARAAWSRDA